MFFSNEDDESDFLSPSGGCVLADTFVVILYQHSYKVYKLTRPLGAILVQSYVRTSSRFIHVTWDKTLLR